MQAKRIRERKREKGTESESKTFNARSTAGAQAHQYQCTPGGCRCMSPVVAPQRSSMRRDRCH